MKEMWKKFIAWLKCEGEDDQIYPFYYPSRYSENIERFPIHGKITDEDIIQLSHKLGDGKYETCYVRMKDMKEYIKS